MEQQWINLKEQTPKEPSNNYYGDAYLATTSDGQVIYVSYVKRNICNEEVFRWNWNDRICPYDITAYMPLPKPYKEV